MIAILWTLVYSLGYIAVGLLAYCIYSVVIEPWLVMRKYRKYSNVHISDDYWPVMGNFVEYLRDMKEGRAYYDHARRNAPQI